MSHGVLLPLSIAAMKVDAWNRSAISASSIDNGNVLTFSGKSSTAGQGELWTAVAPNSGTSVLTGLWMAYEPEVVITTSGSSQFKGLDPDVRNFYNLANKPFSAFRLQLGDILRMTTDCLYGAYSAGVTTHANATDVGGFELEWANAVGTGILSLELIGVSYFSLATGAMDKQRVDAYDFQVVVL
jgi:hypothetical protein